MKGEGVGLCAWLLTDKESLDSRKCPCRMSAVCIYRIGDFLLGVGKGLMTLISPYLINRRVILGTLSRRI